MTRRFTIPTVFLAFGLLGCARATPQTSYYQLVPPASVASTEATPSLRKGAAGQVLLVDDLSVNAAYDNPQIAYREGPYKLDYYDYHRWSAPPGELVSDYLRSAYAKTGRFSRVVREFDDEAGVTLTGRVLSLEEVDRSREQWVASIELELELRDNDSGEVLWSARVDEEQPLAERTPEGLARAVSSALERVVERTAPEIAAAAEEAGEVRDSVAVDDR